MDNCSTAKSYISPYTGPKDENAEGKKINKDKEEELKIP